MDQLSVDSAAIFKSFSTSNDFWVFWVFFVGSFSLDLLSYSFRSDICFCAAISSLDLASSWRLRFSIVSSYFFTTWALFSYPISFLWALFFTHIALEANYSVETVCWMFSCAGEMFAIKVVKELPPNAGDRSRVSLESRNGTNAFFWPLLKMLITWVRQKRLVLMNEVSFMFLTLPSTFSILSEPARSTKLRQE